MLVAASRCAQLKMCDRVVTRWRWPASGCGYLAGYLVCDGAGHAIACRVDWHGIQQTTVPVESPAVDRPPRKQ